MKRNLTLSLAAIIFGSFFLLSYIDGPANGGNIAATGEPGSVTTCVTCHSSGQSVTVEIVVLDEVGDTVDTYSPGEDYTAKVLIEGVGWFPEGFGFQMVSLLDDNSDVDGWSDPGSNVQISQLGMRSYAEHTTPKATGDFDIKWTAPESGSGEVTFYAGGNGVNRNNSNSGDGASLTTLKLAEATSTSVINPELAELSLFPNPASDFIRINMKMKSGERAQLSIFDMQGKLVESKTLLSSSNNLDEQVGISNLEPSTYMMTIRSGDQFLSRLFVKN